MATIEDKLGTISFIRTSGKVLGNTCHACCARKLADNEFGLIIDMDSAVFQLCSYHEGVLLEKLLTNYLKRKARGSKAGFIGPIPKESVQEGEKNA